MKPDPYKQQVSRRYRAKHGIQKSQPGGTARDDQRSTAAQQDGADDNDSDGAEDDSNNGQSRQPAAQHPASTAGSKFRRRRIENNHDRMAEFDALMRDSDAEDDGEGEVGADAAATGDGSAAVEVLDANAKAERETAAQVAALLARIEERESENFDPSQYLTSSAFGKPSVNKTAAAATTAAATATATATATAAPNATLASLIQIDFDHLEQSVKALPWDVRVVQHQSPDNEKLLRFYGSMASNRPAPSPWDESACSDIDDNDDNNDDDLFLKAEEEHTIADEPTGSIPVERAAVEVAESALVEESQPDLLSESNDPPGAVDATLEENATAVGGEREATTTTAPQTQPEETLDNLEDWLDDML